MIPTRRIVAVILVVGTFMASCGTKNPTSPTSQTAINIAGTWTANVVVSNTMFHDDGVIAGTLVITQQGTQFVGMFTGTQTFTGHLGSETKDVEGSTDIGTITGQQVRFSDGLGLDYVGTIDPGTPPSRIAGTASGALVYKGVNLLMNGTWTLVR